MWYDYDRYDGMYDGMYDGYGMPEAYFRYHPRRHFMGRRYPWGYRRRRW